MNNKCKFLIVLFLILMVATLQVQAEKYKGPIVKKSPKDASGCLPPSQNTNLALNNVRALLKSNGTMWFLERAEYEVPKGSGKTSLFSSSLWIGGWSAPDGGSLHMAAMRFAQIGNDYWTGPLSMKDATIAPASCSYYDKFYSISRVEVERHINAFRENDASYNPPLSILNWPAHGRDTYGESRFLAPYQKLDPSGDVHLYEPEKGDYPYYDFDNHLCPWTPENLQRAKKSPWLNSEGDPDPIGGFSPNPAALDLPLERIETRQSNDFGWDNKMIAADHVLKGDETVFWFLNDKGSNHGETKGNAIGLEIRVQAFAFATNDELNKMTFYSYEIINRGSITLYKTYFSQWCDPDLGFADDDFVGCDVTRGLGYCYNGKEQDGSGQIWAYGANPPAVGLDFFQGPYIDRDGVDNPIFEPGKANITGNPVEQEYCKRFVHHIVNNLNAAGAETETYLLPGTSDTIPWNVLRWNDQFAINGVNFGDSIVDNERFGMRAFTYHNNANGTQGDPDLAAEYYFYLSGIWKDGNTPFTYGGSGFSTDLVNSIRCDFVFPAGTDFCNWGTKGVEPGSNYFNGGRAGNWSERMPNGVGSSPNEPADRRFMQSAGPFTLKQGSCNYITVGVPWARALQGGVEASVELLMVADDKCQVLFEKCFKLLDGPDAPNLTIREYDQKLIVLLTNPPYSNNANEDYLEMDQMIPKERIDINDTIIYKDQDTVIWSQVRDTTFYDRDYRFEGYQIFQVLGPEVGASDLDNPSLARLVRQFDVENYNSEGSPIGRLINWNYDEVLQTDVPKEMVSGNNGGIYHTFEITQDAFATGVRQLVNYKTYYFIAVAYAYNEYLHYTTDQNDEFGLFGQKAPYLRGRKTAEGRSVTPIAAVPHPPYVHGGGATLHSDYGSIPYITRIDGQGNGGIALDLMPETIDKIVSGGDHGDYRVRELKYDKNAGPLNVKVIDPLRVKPFDFTLVIKDFIMDNDSTATQADKNKTDVSGDSYWVLTIDQTVTDDELREVGLVDNADNPIREFVSQTLIGQSYEQIIMPLGISLNIYNTDFSAKEPKITKFWTKLLRKYEDDLYRIKYIFNQTEKIDKVDEIVFANNEHRWITGLEDDNVNLPSNWIRSGFYNLGLWVNIGEQIMGHFDKERLEDAHFPSASLYEPKSGSPGSDRGFKDYTGKFGTLCGGTWSPYVLASPYDNGPQIKYTVPEKIPFSEGKEDPSYHGANINGRGLNNYYDFKELETSFSQPGYNQTMTNLYSVNVVLTPDKSKWTRSIVLESCQDRNLSEGNALKGEPRKAKSVDKEGNPVISADNPQDGFGPNNDEGMGWFPGYAINLETGERLNIMFAENSSEYLNYFEDLVKGKDMIFNPTSTYAIATIDIPTFFILAGDAVSKEQYDVLYENMGVQWMALNGIERVWGGMHYVYVCNSAGNTAPGPYINRSISSVISGIPNNYLLPSRRNFNLLDSVFTYNHGGNSPSNPRIDLTWGGNQGYMDAEKKYPFYDCGPYDESRWLVQKFKRFVNIPDDDKNTSIFVRKHEKMQLFNNVMYTHIPMQPRNTDLHGYWLSCDVTYKIRVTRPYLRYISRWYEAPELRNADYTVPNEYEQYNGYPIYKLSTRGLEPTFNDTRLYQTILDQINIVPNPYYGSSLYEGNAIETMVKITNLPTDLKNKAPVTINIYTVSGILVRTLTKGDSETSYINWDLKNYANIPIASGVYIMHVNCPGVGERMLKFFCTMRQTDLNTF